MNLPLENWLASATLNLALSERQRIYEEISAHVRDARDHLLEQGLSELDAETRAIQDLGDPRVARAAFLRTCYTVSDEQRHEKLLGRSWWSLPLAALCICIFVSATVLTFSDAFIVLNEGITRSSPWFVPLILSPLFFTPIYYFEPSIKRWLFNRFSRHGVYVVQIFMILLAAVWMQSVIDNVSILIQSFMEGKITYSIGTWIAVLILSYRWIAHQAPLTLKTIRRTRA